MDAASARNAISREKRSVSIPKGQVALLILLLGVGSALILATIQQASFNSVFLLGFVAIGGLVLCQNTQIRLNDQSLKILGYFWLIKLGLSLLLLYAGWMPQLDESSSAWGYDPQRYYFQAQELIDYGWSTDFISLNYVGILYYYGAIFYVLGHNPVIPALINAFVTLVASLYLVKVGYEIKRQKGPRDWTLAFALLLPELLWFDVMTSRETLVAALLLFAMLTTGRYLARTAPLSFFKVLAIVGLSVLAIAAVRTSMVFPVFISVVLMILLVKPQRGSRVVQRAILVVAAAVILIVLPGISGYLGGYDFDMGKALQQASSATGNIALSADMEWSENSIGMLLMPEGVLQSILFLPPRMVLYLVAPLPNIWLSVSDLLAGSWGSWQKLFTLLSSVINVLAIPYALASFAQSIKRRKENVATLVFHVSYLVTFVAIAGGNLIIHERYRVMATLLLWGCAWLGATTCSKRLIVSASLLWYGLLTFGALFYLGYKLL
ncbi:MAG: hypothetical protein KJ900_01015 [Proteobacteria bacterium]|nr:hypothetical protein [Desulfocapsa sp.]MBU3943853.1 hypothetical protein [Pseudomonadota bacterium]MCG2745777.1 hypothetical protein [Desulfobacteraceae bacterium]MBU4027998.1 hypothetical protein [Pseudomonadota bacterium]MBU4041469.1 hypothetical protein [Pseudomonadota bacterium]